MLTLSESQVLLPQLINDRRTLHQFPELSFQEKQTAAFVEKRLREIGLTSITTRVGGHYGILAEIPGKHADRFVALRADMDALPINEEWPSEYESKNVGVSHMCGHDSHTTMLLGAAQLLWNRRHELERSVKLVFQHAEEKCPGGAVDFIEAGHLENVEEIYGLHVDPREDVGRIGLRDGHFLAGASTFEMIFNGKGGHAAVPQETNDVILACSHLIQSLQGIISRQTDPMESTVISITKVHGGTADNVIPEQVKLGGTIRGFRDDWHEVITEKIMRHVNAVCGIYGCTIEVNMTKGYPPLLNHSNAAEKFRATLTKNLPELELFEVSPIMAGEDFARYLQHVPGCFAFIGASTCDPSERYMLHHPKFHIDEQVLPKGAAVLAAMALSQELLPE